MDSQSASANHDWFAEDGSNNWAVNDLGFDGAVLMYYQPTGTIDACVFTQGLNLVAGTSYRLKFKAASEMDIFPHNVRVSLGASADDLSMGIELVNQAIPGSLDTYSIDFVAPTTDVYFIGFNVFTDESQGALLLDDISVDLSPACSEPVSPYILLTDASSATIYWQASVTVPEIGYEYYYNTDGSVPNTTTIGNGTTTAFTANLENLMLNTTYYTWVRTLCNATETSEWASAGSVYTGICIPEEAWGDAYFDDMETVGGSVNIGNLASDYAVNSYGNYYDVHAVHAEAGQIIQFNFTTVGGMWGDAGVSAYIDLNNDLQFNPNELIYASSVASPETGGFICAGESVVIDAGVEDMTYEWSTNETTQTIEVSATGVYTVEVSNGGCSSLGSVSVTVQSLPTVTIQASDLVICEGGEVTLLATGAEEYEWEDGLVDAERTVNPIATSSYSVVGTTNGCSSSATTSIIVDGECVGVVDLTERNLQIYPNPTNYTTAIVGDDLMANFSTYAIVDLSGRTVANGVVDSNEITLNVQSFIDGIYMIHLNGAQNKVLKLEVKH